MGIKDIIFLNFFGSRKLTGFMNLVKIATILKLIDLDNVIDNIFLIILSPKGLL